VSGVVCVVCPFAGNEKLKTFMSTQCYSYPPQYPRSSIPLNHSVFFLFLVPFSFPSLFGPLFLFFPPPYSFFFFFSFSLFLLFLPFFFFCVLVLCVYICAYLATLYPYSDNNKIHVCRTMITSSISKLNSRNVSDKKIKKIA